MPMPNTEPMSLAEMTDLWCAEVSLSKVVTALTKNPNQEHIEMVCKAAFVDGAMHMLKELNRRSNMLFAETQEQQRLFGPDMAWRSGV
jgi:hypothetical protein